MSNETSALVEQFKAKGGEVNKLPTLPKNSALFIARVLKAREQTGKDGRAFASYFYVELISKHNHPVDLPERFGIAGTLADLKAAEVGKVFCFPVNPFIGYEHGTDEHNILFRTRALIFKPGKKPEKKNPPKPVSPITKPLSDIGAIQIPPANTETISSAETAKPVIAPAFNRKQKFSPLEVLETSTARHRILWAIEKHKEQGRIALTTSGGIQSSVLLHMVSSISKETGYDIPIVFIDTEHLAADTYRYMEELKKALGITLLEYRPAMSARHQESLYGRQWDEDGQTTDLYKEINKREPMRRAIKDLGITCWISGQRRDQGEYRADLPVLQQDGKVEKIYPLIDWSESKIIDYMQRYNLPFHPLTYTHKTVGDYFENPEQRTECGLHTGLSSFDPKI